MADFTPKPLVYNANQPRMPKLEKPLTLQQAEALPEVKQALDRWNPTSKDDYRIDSLGIRSQLSKDKPALNYLADPTKRGVMDFVSTVAFFLIPDLLLFVASLSIEKISHPWVKNVLKTIKPNNLTFLGFGLGLAAIQAFFSMSVADKQKKANQQALKAIATYGINAKYGE
jgi:hypothetical protein